MKNIIKQSVGIDISMDSFTACVCRTDKEFSLSFSKVARFENNESGFGRLVNWVNDQTSKECDIFYLMEATGVYHESLSHFLFNKGYMLHVILPNKSKNYFKSLNLKSKTDSLDAKFLSQMAAERKFEVWTPPSKFYSRLRKLTRFYSQLIENKTIVNNQLHSYSHSNGKAKFIITSSMRLIKQLEKEIARCLAEIKKLIASDTEVKEKIDKLITIPGVGFKTAVSVVGETRGFFMIKSRKQIVSYAGFDVVDNQSGTSVHGKTRISKKGNRYLRGAMYFPALVAVRYGSEFADLFKRVVARRKIKMVGYVAVQRKILSLMFTLWKNNELYDKIKAASK